jgi:hypothetical protein
MDSVHPLALYDTGYYLRKIYRGFLSILSVGRSNFCSSSPAQPFLIWNIKINEGKIQAIYYSRRLEVP